MSELEELLPKKGEQVNDKVPANEAGGKERLTPLERRNQCYAMIEDAALNAVGSEKQYQSFLDVVSRFDRYSLNNQLLIYAQNPEATLLKDFDAWEKEKKTVAKGSHGIFILYPNDYTGKDGVQRRGYDAKTVFDCSAVADYEPEKRPEHSHRDLMRAVIKACPVTIMVLENYPSNVTEGAYYDIHDKCVFAKPGMGNEEMFASLVHAAAHAQIAIREGEEYRPEKAEFEARSIAYVLARKYDIPGDLVSVGSVPSEWRQMESEDVKNSLKGLQSAVKEMSGKMMESLAQGREVSRQEVKRDTREAR